MALVKHITEIPLVKVDVNGALNTQKRLLLGRNDNVPLFSVRLFEVGTGGQTPSHSHDFEHEIFVLEGEGVLVSVNSEILMKKGSVVFIPPMEQHQIKNRGKDTLLFLCMVPKEYE